MAADQIQERLSGMDGSKELTFQHIYRTHRLALHRYLARRTGNESDAADLTQETFARLYEKNIHPESAKAWLYKTSYHLFVDEWRKKRKAVHVPFEAIPEMPAVSAAPEMAAIGAELRLEIGRALAELKPRDRQVLLLLAQCGLSYREIAENIGCTENAVKTVVHRARKRMRQLMEAR